MTRILECTPPRHTESHRTFTVVTKCRKRQNRHTSCPSVLLNKTDKAINAKTEGQMTAQTKAERIFSAELTAGAIQVRWCRMLKRHKEYFRNSLRYAYQCLGSRGLWHEYSTKHGTSENFLHALYYRTDVSPFLQSRLSRTK